MDKDVRSGDIQRLRKKFGPTAPLYKGNSLFDSKHLLPGGVNEAGPTALWFSNHSDVGHRYATGKLGSEPFGLNLTFHNPQVMQRDQVSSIRIGNEISGEQIGTHLIGVGNPGPHVQEPRDALSRKDRFNTYMRAITKRDKNGDILNPRPPANANHAKTTSATTPFYEQIVAVDKMPEDAEISYARVFTPGAQTRGKKFTQANLDNDVSLHGLGLKIKQTIFSGK